MTKAAFWTKAQSLVLLVYVEKCQLPVDLLIENNLINNLDYLLRLLTRGRWVVQKVKILFFPHTRELIYILKWSNLNLNCDIFNPLEKMSVYFFLTLYKV